MKHWSRWRTAYGVALAQSLYTGRRHRVTAVQPYPFPFHRIRRWRVEVVSPLPFVPLPEIDWAKINAGYARAIDKKIEHQGLLP